MFPIRRLAATGAGPASSTSRSPEPRSVHGFGSAGFKGSSQHVIAGAYLDSSVKRKNETEVQPVV